MKFASLIGVKFKNWECGHRYLSSAGCAILSVAENYPEVFVRDRDSLINQIKSKFN